MRCESVVGSHSFRSRRSIQIPLGCGSALALQRGVEFSTNYAIDNVGRSTINVSTFPLHHAMD